MTMQLSTICTRIIISMAHTCVYTACICVNLTAINLGLLINDGAYDHNKGFLKDFEFRGDFKAWVDTEHFSML